MSGTESVRRVMTQAACVVGEELDRLHRELREKDELIKIKDRQLVQLLVDYATVSQRRKQAEANMDMSLRFFIGACLAAGVAISYAVWVG